jgi:hypothetical protein
MQRNYESFWLGKTGLDSQSRLSRKNIIVIQHGDQANLIK